MLSKVLTLLSGKKGSNPIPGLVKVQNTSKTIEDALWDLVERTDGNIRSAYLYSDGTGYYADVSPRSYYQFIGRLDV